MSPAHIEKLQKENAALVGRVDQLADLVCALAKRVQVLERKGPTHHQGSVETGEGNEW